MLVNNSLTESAIVSLVLRGEKTKVYSYDWDGEEYEGAAYSGEGAPDRADGKTTIRHWMAPGQEAVYRVETIL